MRRPRLSTLLAPGFLVTIAASSGFVACTPGEPEPQPIESWAYIIPASFRAERIEQRLAQHDMLCLGVYRLNASGRVYAEPSLSKPARALLAKARQGKRTFPLISLRGPRDGTAMLRDPKSRQAAIDQVAELIHRKHYDGVHIDFEFLPGESAPDYAKFLAALKSHPQMRQRTLSIAAFPPLHDTPEAAAFFDLKIIGEPIDEIVYMPYDYHLRKPGPVTDLAWARQNMELVLKNGFPAKQIWLGVPAYGYAWPDGRPGRPKAISESAGLAQCRQYGCVRHNSGMLKVSREDRVVYVSDRELRRRMANLAYELNLRGTAMWRVGFEVYAEALF